jgi:pyrroline-5-carboxylate reductase
MTKKVVVIGAGALGGAILKGLRATVYGASLYISVCEPNPCESLSHMGLEFNPKMSDFIHFDIVLLCLKPQIWRDICLPLKPFLNPNAIVLSVMAGVRISALDSVFEGHPIGRIMPTTGVSTTFGVASYFADNTLALDAIKRIFSPIATTVALGSEDLIDSATAVSGSGPAYVYAFVESLEAAAQTVGLTYDDARILARATLVSAAKLLEVSDILPSELRRQVTSPNGTTHAGLEVLMGQGGLNELMERTVKAAYARAKTLG